MFRRFFERANKARVFAALALTGAIVLLSGACEKKASIEPEGIAGSPADLGCPAGLPGPALVRIQTGDGTVFCMDQREVVWAEYRTFLAAKAGSTAGQPGGCEWNTSFEPEYQTATDSRPSPYKCFESERPTSEAAPANCLDFCDALAYCEWAGKRLCGRVGGPTKWGRVDVAAGDDGGYAMTKQAVSDLAATTAMEFGYACTQGGKTLYPYGDTYESGRCIDCDWVSKGSLSLDVTDLSTRTCHGTLPPFAQIYDLSGSVEEWQNLCWESIGLSCLIIGGSPGEHDKESLACAADVGFPYVRSVSAIKGFRCCADGVPVSKSTR